MEPEYESKPKGSAIGGAFIVAIVIGIGTCWALSGDTPVVAPGGIYSLKESNVALMVLPGIPEGGEVELRRRIATVLSKGDIVRVLSINNDSWFEVNLLRSREDRTVIAYGWVMGSLLVGHVDEVAKPQGW